MPSRASTRSPWPAVVLLAIGILAIHRLGRAEMPPPATPLREFPETIGSWKGTDMPLSPSIVQAVGLDDYINRVYGEKRRWVTLFITYDRSQRTGQTIHSPKNCLPGAGWLPVYSRQLAIPLDTGRWLTMNEYDVVRETQHVLVLYWYQERGRDIASEYAAKFWLTADALRRNRTDGALIRVTTPIGGNRAGAERLAVGFIREFFPRLSQFIPN